MDKQELIVADLKTLNVFTFVEAGSDGQKELQQAKQYLADQAKSLEDLLANCTHEEFRKQWEASLKQTQKTDYRIVALEDFYAAERKKMLAEPLTRITEEKYWDALEALPPLRYERLPDGCERFCMREFFTGSYTEQYFHSKEGWFCRMVDFRDQTTWITRDEVRKAA